ncbi:unnamed protein product [Toxocara canis]|uniref:Integrase n=1 Tax=Toxocara canis TaxID=6265 RepID=A0A183UIB8_TOXCA|nr:unnamed protein product [Toxocara canis]
MSVEIEGVNRRGKCTALYVAPDCSIGAQQKLRLIGVVFKRHKNIPSVPKRSAAAAYATRAQNASSGIGHMLHGPIERPLMANPDIVDVSELGAHTMNESRDSVLIPLGNEPDIRLQYVNIKKCVRFGKLLEDLDTFAIWLSYRHNQGGELTGTPRHHPMMIVTAAVDEIR